MSSLFFNALKFKNLQWNWNNFVTIYAAVTEASLEEFIDIAVPCCLNRWISAANYEAIY